MGASVTEDIYRTHEEIIVAACIDGIVKTTGKMPTEDEMILSLGKVVHDNGTCDYTWKNNVVVTVEPPVLVYDKTKNGMLNRKMHRRIIKVWEKNRGQKGFR